MGQSENGSKETRPSEELSHQAPLWVRQERLIAACIIAAGVVFRLVAYLHNRSMWINEAMVACNIVQRSFAELAEPLLDFNQAAPLGFLYAVRLSVSVFGPNEYALRLVPLLAGLAALPLFYRLIRRYVDGTSALVGLTLFAVSENIIYHTNELKQYSVDVLLTILALLAVEPVLRGSAKPRHWILLGVTGAVGLWFSHPLLFVLAAAGLVLAGSALYKKDWMQLAKLSAVGLVWVASFGLNYMLITRHVAANQRKLVAFSEQFMPLSFSLETLDWLRSAFGDIAERALRLPTKMGCALIASVCILIGMGRLFARDKVRGSLLLLPLVLCVIASAMHKYPLKGRLMLFLAPTVLIFMGLGAQWFVAPVRRRVVRGLGIALLSVLLLVPTGNAAYRMFAGYSEWEMRPVLEYVLEQKQPGDAVAVFYGSYSEMRYYREAYDYAPERYVKLGRLPEDTDRYLSEMKQLFQEEGPRIWLILGHHEESHQRKALFKALDRVATRMDSIEIRRTAAYLYRAKSPPATETPEVEDSNETQ